jgi:hypothetical protein
MTLKRMDRDQFFARLAPLDDEHLRKLLWNLYWRGSAPLRARIENDLDPKESQRRKAEQEAVDPEWVLSDVTDFVTLARSGAYLGGDRRVKPSERTRWRLTFQELRKQTERALAEPDIGPGVAAMEQLIQLACDTGQYDYFRSEDPVEAARFVVSDAVELLWTRVRDQLGFPEFIRRAAPQLARWESHYGWTRSGMGQVSEREVSLASIVGRMLRAPDAWVQFADCYLEALTEIDRQDKAGHSDRHTREFHVRERTADLAEWHRLLLDRLFGSEAEDRLDRLAHAPALGGPALLFFQAQLAHRRGDLSMARQLIHASLEEQPGHQGFLEFAAEIEAPLPPQAERIAAQRRRI